jgi:HK97 family phage prohead protease
MDGSVKLISATGKPMVHKRMDLTLTGITKFARSGRRRIRGMASTSSVDRQGDIVDPAGGTWQLPVAMLWNHQHSVPVGWVHDIEVRGSGLWIEAEFAEGVGDADRIWAMVDQGLVTSFSIGFRPIKSEPIRGGGMRFTQWELLEVSAVVIPANPDAKIQRRALPTDRPGVVYLNR